MCIRDSFSAVFRVRSVAAAAIHEFFQSRGFVYVHTPLLSEGRAGAHAIQGIGANLSLIHI